VWEKIPKESYNETRRARERALPGGEFMGLEGAALTPAAYVSVMQKARGSSVLSLRQSTQHDDDGKARPNR